MVKVDSGRDAYSQSVPGLKKLNLVSKLKGLCLPILVSF